MPSKKKPVPRKKAVPAKRKAAAMKVQPRRRKPGPKPVAQDKLTTSGVDAICELIVAGKSYREIAAKHKVSVATLANWIGADPERSHACARAREASAQSFDEQALETIHKAKTQFELARAREEAVHLRWRAKAVNPRRYGDKVAVGGAEDLPPMRSVHEMSTEALLAVAAQHAAQ